MYSHASVVKWISKRKGKKLRQRAKTKRRKERVEDWENEKKTTNWVFKWVCRKAAWHWNKHAPSHNSRDINFSTLSVSPPLLSLFPSLFSFSPSALPLHLASSLPLTPFPSFYSFFTSLLSSLFAQSYPPPLPLCPFCNSIVLSPLCVFGNLFLLSIWQCLYLYCWCLWHPRLLPLLPFDFPFLSIKDYL